MFGLFKNKKEDIEKRHVKLKDPVVEQGIKIHMDQIQRAVYALRMVNEKAQCAHQKKIDNQKTDKGIIISLLYESKDDAHYMTGMCELTGGFCITDRNLEALYEKTRDKLKILFLNRHQMKTDIHPIVSLHSLETWRKGILIEQDNNGIRPSVRAELDWRVVSY